MLRVTFTKPCEVVSNVELTRQDHANRGFPGFPTPHFLGLNLEGLQPVEDRRVCAPWRARLARNRSDPRNRLTFHLQSNFRVSIRRGRARMTQIVADRRQVDAGLQERHGCTVSNAVRVKPLLAQIRNISGSTIKTPGEDVA